MWNIIFFNLSLILYLVSTISYLVFIIRHDNWLNKCAYSLSWAAFLSHTIFFGIRCLEVTHLPLIGLFESMAFLGWTLILIFLWIESKYQFKSLGVFILPFVLFILICSSLFSKESVEISPILKSHWFITHVGLAFLSYGAFATSFNFGIMYLLQEQQIKLKNQDVLYYQLPALEILDKLCYKSIIAGFICLTISIITGAIWANSAWGDYWSWQPKQTWSLITWLSYVGCIYARLVIGWRGRIISIWSIINFGFVLFTYLGVNLLLSGLHRF